jgi:hypothetical protein
MALDNAQNCDGYNKISVFQNNGEYAVGNQPINLKRHIPHGIG